MTFRILAFVLLAGASVAYAAPPKSAQPKTPPSDQPPDSIDVDALARAKDAGNAQPADADAPAPEASSSEAPAPAPADVAATVTDAAPSAEAPSTTTNAAPAETAAPAAQPNIVETPAEPAPAQSVETPPSSSPAESIERSSIAAGCVARATSLLDDAAKADYGNATRAFDAKMRTDLPAPKFKQQWESLTQFGKLVARGQSHLSAGQGYTLVMIPLIFEKTNLVAQIACGSDGRIAGFHVTQAPKPQF